MCGKHLSLRHWPHIFSCLHFSFMLWEKMEKEDKEITPFMLESNGYADEVDCPGKSSWVIALELSLSALSSVIC